MTVDQAKETVIWLIDLFPQINAIQAVQIRDSITDLDDRVVRQHCKVQHRQREFFDLPELLKQCRKASDPATEAVARLAANRISFAELTALAEARLAEIATEHARVEADLARIDAMTERQLSELTARALAEAPEWTRDRLIKKRPQESRWLASLVLSQLRKSSEPAGKGSAGGTMGVIGEATELTAVNTLIASPVAGNNSSNPVNPVFPRAVTG